MKSIFEKIIDNKISSFKIYEDDKFIAILDNFPITTGHTLLIPKIKNESIFHENETTQEELIKLGIKLGKQIKNNLKTSGIRLQFNNGKSAGQEVFHTHLHIIPFYDSYDDAKVNEEIMKKIKN